MEYNFAYLILTINDLSVEFTDGFVLFLPVFFFGIGYIYGRLRRRRRLR